jgi:hypothetical protein
LIFPKPFANKNWCNQCVFTKYISHNNIKIWKHKEKKIVKKQMNSNPRLLILPWPFVGDDHIAFFQNNLAQDKHNELKEGEGKKRMSLGELKPF